MDIYSEWLDIPEGPRPPDHYALLGLEKFESNVTRIEEFATARILRVKPRCLKYPEQGTQLLNEIATAKVCLLNAESRHAYDETLRNAKIDELGIEQQQAAQIYPLQLPTHAAASFPDAENGTRDLFDDFVEDLLEEAQTTLREQKSRRRDKLVQTKPDADAPNSIMPFAGWLADSKHRAPILAAVIFPVIFAIAVVIWMLPNSSPQEPVVVPPAAILRPTQSLAPDPTPPEPQQLASFETVLNHATQLKGSEKWEMLGKAFERASNAEEKLRVHRELLEDEEYTASLPTDQFYDFLAALHTQRIPPRKLIEVLLSRNDLNEFLDHCDARLQRNSDHMAPQLLVALVQNAAAMDSLLPENIHKVFAFAHKWSPPSSRSSIARSLVEFLKQRNKVSSALERYSRLLLDDDDSPTVLEFSRTLLNDQDAMQQVLPEHAFEVYALVIQRIQRAHPLSGDVPVDAILDDLVEFAESRTAVDKAIAYFQDLQRKQPYDTATEEALTRFAIFKFEMARDIKDKNDRNDALDNAVALAPTPDARAALVRRLIEDRDYLDGSSGEQFRNVLEPCIRGLRYSSFKNDPSNVRRLAEAASTLITILSLREDRDEIVQYYRNTLEAYPQDDTARDILNHLARKEVGHIAGYEGDWRSKRYTEIDKRIELADAATQAELYSSLIRIPEYYQGMPWNSFGRYLKIHEKLLNRADKSHNLDILIGKLARNPERFARAIRYFGDQKTNTAAEIERYLRCKRQNGKHYSRRDSIADRQKQEDRQHLGGNPRNC